MPLTYKPRNLSIG